MPKSAKILLVSCFLAIAGLLALQAYWIVKYYRITLSNFEKDANLAFEDAIKKEFSLRCDTIQRAIEDRLLDTTYFKISSQLDPDKIQYIYTIKNIRDPKDRYNSSFSLSNINRPLTKNDDSTRQQIAKLYALMVRHEDLENHIVYYRLQDLGRFTVEERDRFQFDTTRLRPVLNTYLHKKGIYTNYSFITRATDSLTSETQLKDSLRQYHATVTKALPTYSNRKNQDFIRAGFSNPVGYVVSNMALILISSLLLIAIITGLIIFILKTLFKEKRLATIKNDFISNITHEFKTPIATIAAAAESLQNESLFTPDEKNSRYLGYIRNETEKLNLLVDTVLHLSVYENGNITLQKEEIAVEDVIKNLIQVHQLSSNKPLHFEYDNISNQHIYADRTQFYHALNNAIDNAIKYSVDVAKIRISVQDIEGYLQLSIKDEGMGMVDSDAKMAFDKFYRVTKGNRHRVKGFGLGLNYVKHIMIAHQGWCKIESKLNQGTTLTLAWPKYVTRQSNELRVCCMFHYSRDVRKSRI